MASPAVTSASTQRGTVPQLSQAAIDPSSGIFLNPWQRFFSDLFTKLGGTATSLGQAIYFQFSNNTLSAFSSLGGALLGNVVLIGGKGPPSVPVVPGSSPFVYPATMTGTLVVDSGKVELSRQGGTFYLVSLVGGAIPVLNGDSVRVSWFREAPVVAFFPTGSG